MTPDNPADILDALDRASTRHVLPQPNGKMVWRIWGQGYPLVLLHGGTGSWAHWVRNIEVLARDFMLVVPDLPGFGESDPAPDALSPDSLAGLVAAGLPQLIGDRRFTLAGFSMGGGVAAHTSPLCAARLDRVVLIGSAGLNTRHEPLKTLRSWRNLPSAAEKAEAHRHNLAVLMLYDPDKIDALAVETQSRNAMQSKVRSSTISKNGSAARHLKAAGVPISSIWGEWDVIATPHLDEIRLLLESVRPDATFDVIPGAGHWIQYEAADTFNRILRARVLAGVSAPQAAAT